MSSYFLRTHNGWYIYIYIFLVVVFIYLFIFFITIHKWQMIQKLIKILSHFCIFAFRDPSLIINSSSSFPFPFPSPLAFHFKDTKHCQFPYIEIKFYKIVHLLKNNIINTSPLPFPFPSPSKGSSKFKSKSSQTTSNQFLLFIFNFIF